MYKYKIQALWVFNLTYFNMFNTYLSLAIFSVLFIKGVTKKDVTQFLRQYNTIPPLGWLVGVNTCGGGFLWRRLILVASAILTVRTTKLH